MQNTEKGNHEYEVLKTIVEIYFHKKGFTDKLKISEESDLKIDLGFTEKNIPDLTSYIFSFYRTILPQRDLSESKTFGELLEKLNNQLNNNK